MSGTMKRIFNFISFIALTLVGVALLLAYFIKTNTISNALQTIAQVLAYVVVMYYAFVYAWSRSSKNSRRLVHMIIWAISAVLVVLFVILNAI